MTFWKRPFFFTRYSSLLYLLSLHQCVAVCESCGALNNAGAAGCLSDGPQPAGNHPVDSYFIACFALESVN